MFNLKHQTILQVLPALNQGGVERGTIDIAEGIIKAGGKALVISSGGKLESQLRTLGAEHIKLPLNSKNPFTIGLNFLRLRKIIREKKVALVHARSRGPAWSAYWATRSLKIPFITTFHGTYNFRNDGKRYYNSVMARGNKVIAISQFIQEHIEKNYTNYIASNNIKIIYRGVDLDYFDPQKVSKERYEFIRKTWGLERNQQLILMVGRLVRWKGQTILLEALNKMKNFNGVCVILGSSQGHDQYLEELQAYVKRNSLTHKVKFIEQCQDMPAAYSLATVVVHASTAPEAFGRVIAEAQAMGKFVIASNLGAPKEIIENKKTGLLIAPSDSLTLKRALETVLAFSLAKRKEISVVARTRVQNLFSKQVMIEETLKIYTEFLQKK